jgi:hypothetical protein
MNAPRYPQFRHSQIDHRFGRPEAQKTLVDPHFGQERALLFTLACLDFGVFAILEECFGDFDVFAGLFLRDFVLRGRFATLAT